MKKSGTNDTVQGMDVDFPKLEEEVLGRWKKEKAFEKSVARRKTGKRFVFYEGPPTANGKPGIHHVLSRAFKDVVLRYKTMRGFFVERRAGWDTHGLPVELQIEKKLGLKSKKDIEKYGIAQFNKECKQSVWEYKKEWEALTERMGFWIDLNDPYITYETPYIETLWRIIQIFWKKGLLYKGHKVILYCSRCGTSLSSHEVAQGYKTVEDISVYVKFKMKPGQKVGNWTTDNSAYILSWTTTPWTLPGNVALAVGDSIKYQVVSVKGKSESYILAKDLVEKILDTKYEILDTILGKDLVGLSYEQLFPMPSLKNVQSHKIYAADFVTTTDGTGVVHTAVMYGDDDYNLGVKVGLPQRHTVTETGVFTQEVPGGLAGLQVRTEETDEKIFAYLKEHNTFFATKPYSHEYPFCWRCSTPLLYYAKDSWFVNMQKVKQALIANNKKINWVPSHLKEGRMGEWLREVKDWAFSRERYWGTPLPIWECKKCEHREVVGSLKELREKTRSHNTYYILRHGHSERQITKVMSSWPEQKPLPLTRKGIKDIGRIAKGFKKKNIDVIFSSDLLRTCQTAEIVGKELGITPLFDERLRDMNVGPELNGKHITELGKVWGKEGETSFEHYMRRFVDPLPGGESWKDVQRRMQLLIQDIEKKYQGKSVLLVSHELPLTMLEGVAEGRSRKDIVAQRMKKVVDTGEVRDLPFSALPLNEDFELDLHRPYIDGVVFPCFECKAGAMQRVKEVADVWYDSGSMPFAQAHWPLEKQDENSSRPPKLFPADYIVEGIDQTRGWFYTLLAVSTLLGFSAPYKNVISFSHVLDEKGEKMSKSKGNVVDPWDMIKKYGIDTVRWYFYTINNPGDPKLFSEKDLQEVLRKFMLTLWNSFVFYQTYVGKKSEARNPKSENILDKWILSRLDGVTKEITEKLDAYDVTEAGRSLEDFVINDLSLWYIRRSRARFSPHGRSPAGRQNFKEASATLGYVLLQTSKLAAPFIPFLSEHIHNALQMKASPSTSLRTSVHWEDWPFDSSRAKSGGLNQGKHKQDKKLEQEMQLVRDLVTKALAERAKAGIKVRQPLASLKIQQKGGQTPLWGSDPQLLDLIKEELNVKEVVFDKNLESDVQLDTTLTPALKEEGCVREILRSIQEMRKEAGYKPQDTIRMWYEGSVEIQSLLLKNESSIKRAVGIKTLAMGNLSEADIIKEIEVGGEKITFSMKL